MTFESQLVFWAMLIVAYALLIGGIIYGAILLTIFTIKQFVEVAHLHQMNKIEQERKRNQ